MDADELEMCECRGNGSRPAIAAAPQPDGKLTHQGGHVARRRCREDHVALSVSDRIRSAAVRTGRKEWVNIIEHEGVDVPHEPLVERDLLVARDLVDEAERLLSREDLERVLSRDGQSRADEDVLHLERVVTVPLDAGGAVDRADPSAMAKPLGVLRIERQVLEEPSTLLEFGDRWLQ
jgi:hypothetical protein